MPSYTYRCDGCGHEQSFQYERGKAPKTQTCCCASDTCTMQRVLTQSKEMIENMPEPPSDYEKKRATVAGTNKRLEEMPDKKRAENFKKVRSELTGGAL